MKGYVLLFLVCDFVFCVAFATIGLWEYRDNGVVLVLLGALLFSYWPLFVYVRDFHASNDREWFANNQHFAALYIAARVVTFALFFCVVVVETAHVDVAYTMIHFGVATDVCLLLMAVALLLLLPLCGAILAHHYKESARGGVVDVTIVYGDNPEHMRKKYDDLQMLRAGEQLSRVLLVPGQGLDVSKEVTKQFRHSTNFS